MSSKDLEVDLRQDVSEKAVIKGKTSVPFETFVKLVTSHQLKSLLPKKGKEPIIVGSTLLTDLASAPHQSRTNQAKLTLVTLGTGCLVGVFLMSVVQVVLMSLGKNVTQQHLVAVVAILLALVALVITLDKLRRKKKDDRLTDIMESLTSLLSK